MYKYIHYLQHLDTMDGSFEVFQIAATNDHLLALLYNDEPEIEPEQTPQFVYWNVLENYHEMDWEDDEIVDDNINWDLENDALRAENNALIADLERRDAALKLLEANMISNKESYETMQDMLAGQLESALHDVDMMAETVQEMQMDKDQCDAAMDSMRKSIIELKLKTMQLEVDLRQKDIELYTIKMEALKQTL